MSAGPTLGDLLAAHQQSALASIRRHGGGVLRFEAEADLLQGVLVRALDSESVFTYRGIPEFLGWLHQLVLRHLADRSRYWGAQRRDAGRLLRMTRSPDLPGGVLEPAASGMGPGTVAERREALCLATRVLDALPPRDRDLVRWSAAGIALEEQATRLEISYAAVQRASLRAVERFRKTFRLAVDRRRGE